MVIGTVLSDRYRLDERIATGGMGSVYEATDERLERKVAVKLLKDGLSEDPRFIERFRREARSAGALSHPNVAAVYDFGTDEDRHYMVMELAQGRDLARVLREEAPLEPERAANIGAQIATALEHAHASGLVHRDIKPPNVIVAKDDTVKVTDFGIARAAGDATLTATGSVLGSAHYISPEQAGGAQIGPSTDIYSLGIVLYEMVTGTVPFTGDSMISVAMRHVSDEVPPPSKLRADLPPEMDRVVARSTAKNPSGRYRSAAEMAAELLAISSPSTSVMGAPAGTTERIETTVWPIPGSRWDPQKVGRNVLIVLGGLVLIAFALLLMRLGGAEQPAGTQQDQQEEPAAADDEEVSEDPVDIPVDIVDQKYKDVQKDLEEAELKVELDFVPSEEIEKDRVISSDPAPGSEVQPGDTVTLQVSSGEPEDDGDEDPGKGKGNAKGKGKKDD